MQTNPKFCYCWVDADFNWNTNEFTWNDVCIVLDLAQKGGGYFDEFQKLEKEEKEEFIKLILKVKGEKIVEKKKRKRYKVTATDVELTVKTVLNEINIKIDKNS